MTMQRQDITAEATERVTRAMYRIRSNTSLMGIGTMSDMVQEYKPALIPTCATDGKHIYFSPVFVQSMNDPELRFVMIHEIMHISWSHHLRLEGRNMRVANIAMDFMVNGTIVNTQAYKDGFLAMPKGGLYDPFFVGKNWSFETIYDYLIANAGKYPQVDEALKDEEEQQNPQPSEDSDCDSGSSSGTPDDDVTQGCDSETQDTPQADDKSQDPGAGQPDPGQPSANDKSQDTNTEDNKLSGAGDDDASGGGRPSEMDGYDTWGEVWPAPAEVMEKAKEEHDAIQEKLAEADFMEKSFSPFGGSDHVCGTMREEPEDTVGWQHLKDILQDAYSEERTWSRPNLLRISQGYYSSRNVASGTLHVCLDTSGSVSEHELQIFLANTRAICDTVGVHTLKIAYVDSCLRRPLGETWQEVSVSSGEEIELHIAGRGGTDFNPVFEAIEEEQEDVQCLVYFTDGWGGCYLPPPDYHVVWATTDQPVRWWGEHGEWGETIEIAPSRW